MLDKSIITDIVSSAIADTDIFIVAAVLADNTTGTLKIIRR